MFTLDLSVALEMNENGQQSDVWEWKDGTMEGWKDFNLGMANRGKCP